MKMQRWVTAISLINVFQFMYSLFIFNLVLWVSFWILFKLGNMIIAFFLLQYDYCFFLLQSEKIKHKGKQEGSSSWEINSHCIVP